MHIKYQTIYRIFIIILLCISIFIMDSFSNYVYSVSDYQQAFLLNQTYTSLTETKYYNFYTESDLTYDKVFDPITYCLDLDLRNQYNNLITKYQEDYYNTYSIILNGNLTSDELTKYNQELNEILDSLQETKDLLEELDNQSQQKFNEEYQAWVNSYTNLINESKTKTITETSTLTYDLHVPFNYDSTKSYPILVVVGNENTKFNDFDGFYSNWYSQVKYKGLSQYDCFIIHLNPSNKFFVGYEYGIGINSLSLSGEDGCYKLTSNITKDYNYYNATYSNVYNAHRIDYAPEEQLLCNLIDQLAGEYNINAERQYIMGYELGATFAVDLISKNPKRFAAGIIICPESCDISENNCKDLTTTNLWFVNYDENTICNRYLCSFITDSINNCRAKYNTGYNYTTNYTNLIDNEIDDFLKGYSVNSKEGPTINDNLQILNFLFDSTKVINTVYLTETAYLWGDDNQSCTAVKYYTENGIKKSYTISTNTTYVMDQKASCEINEFGHYEAYFSETDKSIYNLEDQKQEACSVEMPDTAIGHNYGRTHFLLSDDKKTCCAEKKCENNPNHVITETVEVTYIKQANATLFEEETGYYQAIFTNPIFGVYKTISYENKTSRIILLGIVIGSVCAFSIVLVIILNTKLRKDYDRRPLSLGKKKNKCRHKRR